MVVLLLLMVVRPLLRNLTAAAKVALAPAPQLPRAANGVLVNVAGRGSRPGTAIAYEQQIAQARSMVAKDPARVAQVVKDWVQKDDMSVR